MNTIFVKVSVEQKVEQKPVCRSEQILQSLSEDLDRLIDLGHQLDDLKNRAEDLRREMRENAARRAELEECRARLKKLMEE